MNRVVLTLLASVLTLFALKFQAGTNNNLLYARTGEDSQIRELAEKILQNDDFKFVSKKAESIVATGFNAGDGYGEVWIRDFATFMELACAVHPRDEIRKNLLLFFRFQGEDGNIVDGFIPASKKNVSYKYIERKDIPGYAAHKNTVETDQETSLLQAVHTYIRETGDDALLQEVVNGKTVLERMEEALEYLLQERYAEKYGLLWGATTADWGDVQPEHDWGVVLDGNSHRTIDIYDNAMLLSAIDNYLEFIGTDASASMKWKSEYNSIRKDHQDKSAAGIIYGLGSKEISAQPREFR